MSEQKDVWYVLSAKDPDGNAFVSSDVYARKEDAEDAAKGVNRYPRCSAQVQAKTYDQLNSTQQQYLIDEFNRIYLSEAGPLREPIILNNSTTGEEVRFTPDPSSPASSLVRVEIRTESTGWNWTELGTVPKNTARSVYSEFYEKYSKPRRLWIEQ